MPSTAGKRALVKVGLSATGPAAVVTGVKAFQHEVSGTMVDDSELSTEYVKRIRGLNDAKVTLTGGRRLENTDGQGTLRDALRDGTSVFLQVRAIHEFEFRQEMLVRKFGVDVSVEGRVGFSCELDGAGAIDIAVAGMAIGTEGADYVMTEGGNYLATEE